MRKDVTSPNIQEDSLHTSGEDLNLTQPMLIYLGLGQWGVLLPHSPGYCAYIPMIISGLLEDAELRN